MKAVVDANIIMNLSDTASYLDTTEDVLRYLIKKRQIPYKKRRQQFIFVQHDIDVWLAGVKLYTTLREDSERKRRTGTFLPLVRGPSRAPVSAARDLIPGQELPYYPLSCLNEPPKPVGIPENEEPDPEEDHSGFVYIIRCGRHYKIGKARNVTHRLSAMQTVMPEPATLIHTIPAHECLRAEQVLHQHFQNKRVHREWFALEDDDIQWLRNLSVVEIEGQDL